ncbi:SDR family NAD(P)-dependent oxidoreductase [Gordonia sp. HNM0687]|uniref:SDR family NAD(P)-dependent oxidoreductase n=1 Tax=Gordonia mangrovi TaxID=2665643 RepID=A0A6L7GTL7_9ACTN|nr:SDR family NAD(P)-dependent oxidoreductase [Gordonia mangrovi]MXP23359.1 SDR family NAD(P)-dependent oxidoreductase [Gordonia mangrovi]UVF76734.1 SDR family NAD(P)-dependent oxidoreductase [Gordonia mangrovi]
MDLAHRKAVVVGGASGMGRATAEALAAGGATVAILDREGSDGKDVAAEIGGTFHAVDILDFDGTEGVLADAVSEMGGLHIAVNTAGGGRVQKTLGRSGPHDLDMFRQVVDLNLVGTFNLNRLQAQHMSANDPVDEERGVIVNTSSLAAFEGQIGQVAYAAAKAGIAGSALAMARDLGPLGIRVVAIAPSLFSTGATAKFSEDQVAPLVKDAAFPKRMGRPSEYAKLALAIVDNPMLNGQCLRLDAGQRFAPR